MKKEENEETPITATRKVADVHADTEIERLKAENEALRTASRDALAQRTFTDELKQLGAISPDLLFASVKHDLQFADDGTLINYETLMQRLKSDHSEQFMAVQRSASIDGAVGATISPGITKAALAKMKPAEIAAMDWADVKRVLSGT